jgi:hypothetical protein
VVIELFTSEGCSSCPPADDLLANLVNEAKSTLQPVYAMAFHVDYWDGLGWRDPFSSPDSSARQRTYAAAFGTDQVYTPQMIINGNPGFIGSDAIEARKQIRKALEKAATSEVMIDAKRESDGRLTVAYAIKGAAKGAVLNVVAVETNAVSQVQRGENAGRSLRHVNVVRAFATASLTEKKVGKIELKAPGSLNAKNALIVGFVADGNTMTVTGAAGAGFPP